MQSCEQWCGGDCGGGKGEDDDDDDDDGLVQIIVLVRGKYSKNTTYMVADLMAKGRTIAIERCSTASERIIQVHTHKARKEKKRVNILQIRR